MGNPDNLNAEVFLLSGLGHACDDAPDALNRPTLRARVRELLVVKQGEDTLPAFNLLPNSRRGQNRMNSFLGANRGSRLEKWIGPEIARKADELSTFASEEMVGAFEGGSCEMWLYATAVLGGFPLPASLILVVEKATLVSDFARAAKDSPKLAVGALVCATSLSRIALNPQVADHLRKQAIAMARELSRGDQVDRALLISCLFECTFNLARGTSDRPRRIARFCELLAELAIAWSRLGEEGRAFVQRLCEELPVEQTTELWRLNLRLRTQK